MIIIFMEFIDHLIAYPINHPSLTLKYLHSQTLTTKCQANVRQTTVWFIIIIIIIIIRK